MHLVCAGMTSLNTDTAQKLAVVCMRHALSHYTTLLPQVLVPHPSSLVLTHSIVYWVFLKAGDTITVPGQEQGSINNYRVNKYTSALPSPFLHLANFCSKFQFQC